MCMLSYSPTLNDVLRLMLHLVTLTNRRAMRHTESYKLQQHKMIVRAKDTIYISQKHNSAYLSDDQK